jgi:hypothetical protein
MQDLMIPFPPGQHQDFDEDMKLRDDDKKWIKKEIEEQIQAALAHIIDSLKPHGWRKAASVVRELGPLRRVSR